MMTMPEFKLRGCFICNNCRTLCNSRDVCPKQLDDYLDGKIYEENKDIYPRKQPITCLGRFCDEPCKLRQEETDLDIETLVTLVKYLGTKCNDLIEEKHRRNDYH